MILNAHYVPSTPLVMQWYTRQANLTLEELIYGGGDTQLGFWKKTFIIDKIRVRK